jgi:homoserine/homoserine lactone efflux protein
MDLTVWLTYLLATIILSLTPGPGVFSCISSGLHHGFRKGLWSGVGMQAANLLIIVFVSLGLGALLLASETLFTLVKWAGVAYLVYLGVVTWRSPARGFEEDRDDDTHAARDIFLRGFWVNATNPKSIIFFAAILPQFIDVDRPQLVQYVIITATTLGVDLAAMMACTALAARVFRLMREPRHLRWINRTLGGTFIACGLALASFRRAASAVIPA